MINVNAHACPQNHPCPAVRSCPFGAIVQGSHFVAPHIEHEKCTDCGVCTQVCPVFSYTRDEAEVL